MSFLQLGGIKDIIDNQDFLTGEKLLPIVGSGLLDDKLNQFKVKLEDKFDTTQSLLDDKQGLIAGFSVDTLDDLLNKFDPMSALKLDLTDDIVNKLSELSDAKQGFSVHKFDDLLNKFDDISAVKLDLTDDIVNKLSELSDAKLDKLFNKFDPISDLKLDLSENIVNKLSELSDAKFDKLSNKFDQISDLKLDLSENIANKLSEFSDKKIPIFDLLEDKFTSVKDLFKNTFGKFDILHGAMKSEGSEHNSLKVVEWSHHADFFHTMFVLESMSKYVGALVETCDKATKYVASAYGDHNQMGPEIVSAIGKGYRNEVDRMSGMLKSYGEEGFTAYYAEFQKEFMMLATLAKEYQKNFTLNRVKDKDGYHYVMDFEYDGAKHYQEHDHYYENFQSEKLKSK